LQTKKNKEEFLMHPETLHLESVESIEIPIQSELLPEKQQTSSHGFGSFFRTNAFSYLATLTLAVASMTAIFVFQNQNNILQAFAGLLLTLGLPGYALTKALFTPKTLGPRQGHTGLLFTVALSVVLSVVVVSLVAFALDLTPIGVSLVSLNLSLFTLTLVFGAVGLWRRYSTSKSTS
jgi:uncharacterized membrane protein